MPTRQDLIVATLKLLNAIAAGQSPEAEDVETVDDTIDGKLNELTARRIWRFADYDEFEDELIDPLAIILANASAPAFGQPRNPVSVLAAEGTLREMRQSDWIPGNVTPSQYF